MSFDEQRWCRFKSTLRQQSHLIEGETLKNRERAEIEYRSFLDFAHRGECYICKKSVKTFSSSHPCPHWLLRPKGVKKEHVFTVLRLGGYNRSAAYLRWWANHDSLSRNINDLKEEGDLNAYFHWTCRCKHLLWTFKCARSDFEGHPTTQHNYPHYHFEMRLSGQPFIKFGDFHVPFTDEDMFWLQANDDPDSPIKQTFAPHGSGMQDALSIDPDTLLEHVATGGDYNEDKAVFQIDSFVHKEGGISGEVVQSAIEASKKTGKTIAFHLKEAGLDPRIIVSPARTVIEKSDRSPRNRGKKKS